MLLLFLSFLKIEFANALQEIRKMTSILSILCLIKLLVLPTGLLPDPGHLAGICSSCPAPFRDLHGRCRSIYLGPFECRHITGVDDGDCFLPAGPFLLPALVELLAGQTIDISFLSMVKTLAMLVFLPALAAILLRRRVPSFLKKLDRVQFPVSLVISPALTWGSLGSIRPISGRGRERWERPSSWPSCSPLYITSSGSW